MKINKNCVRAFVKSNLGDDLFLYVLCNRYPKEEFVVCSFLKFRKSVSDIPNLHYISIDQLVIKWIFRVLYLGSILLNRVFQIINGKTVFRKITCFDMYSALCKENILISGSLFIENKKSKNSDDKSEIGKNHYQKSEEIYYSRNPYVLGCNFGPYYTEEYRERYQKLFEKAKQVSFRDSYSSALFCGNNISWSPDILFTYPKDKCEKPDIRDYVLISVLDPGKDLQGNSMLTREYVNFMIKLVNRLTIASEKIVLMGFCIEQGDDKICSRIYDSVDEKQNVSVINYPTIHYNQAVGYLANAKYVIATRYHAMILGWLYEKNVYPIVYNEKMKHVIDDISDQIVYSNIDDLNDDVIDVILQSVNKSDFSLQTEIRDAIQKSEKHFEKLDELFKR